MEPVNWLAVVLASLLAVMIGIVWFGPLFNRAQPFFGDVSTRRRFAWTGGLLLFVSAAMLGHMFARLGSDRRTRLVESGYYLVAYLAMGTVFWALG